MDDATKELLWQAEIRVKSLPDVLLVGMIATIRTLGERVEGMEVDRQLAAAARQLHAAERDYKNLAVSIAELLEPCALVVDARMRIASAKATFDALIESAPPPAAQQDGEGKPVKLFQINEDDLAELERTIPQFADALMPHLDNRLRAQIRRVQAILSSVRWNYGPPTEVERIEHDSQENPMPTPDTEAFMAGVFSAMQYLVLERDSIQLAREIAATHGIRKPWAIKQSSLTGYQVRRMNKFIREELKD